MIIAAFISIELLKPKSQPPKFYSNFIHAPITPHC
jgi:hypothetical protein